MEASIFRAVSLGLFILSCFSYTVKSEIREETSIYGVVVPQPNFTRYGDIKEEYILLWKPLSAIEESSWELESNECQQDADCYKYFPNMNVAFAMDSNLPSKPYCENTTSPGYCSCGEGRCVSFSRDWSNNSNEFYYCGPCGWVGAQCTNHTCTHSLATCGYDYCECVSGGIFYNMAFCYMPFYGKRMLTQMFVSTAIIVALCGVLAYSYHRLSGSRRHDLRRFANWRRNSTVRESPPDDTPPTYDDVVEKVPSYQDAIEMEQSNVKGLDNPAFEDDSLPPPAYEESINSSYISETSNNGTDESSDTHHQNSDQSKSIQTSHPSASHQIQSAEVQHQPIEEPLKNALGDLKTSTIISVEVTPKVEVKDTEGPDVHSQ